MPYEEIITLWLLTHYSRAERRKWARRGMIYCVIIIQNMLVINILRKFFLTVVFQILWRFCVFCGRKKKKRDRSFRFYPFLYNQPKTERGAEASPSMKLLSKRRAVRCTWASARGRRRLPARACRLPLLRCSSRRFSAVSRLS